MDHRIVTPSDAAPRWPLGPWQSLLTPIRSQKVSSANHKVWCLAMNNLALIALHRGDVATARALCLEQIDRLHRARHSALDDHPAGTYGIQPLVNLLRLSGGGADAFAGLYDAVHKARAGHVQNKLQVDLPDRHQRFILAAIRRDPRAQGYVAGVLATALARAAFAEADAALLARAVPLAGGDVRAELQTVAQIWARKGAVDAAFWAHLPSADPLARLYHLLSAARSLDRGTRAALALRGAQQAASAAATRRSHDLLDTATDFLCESVRYGVPSRAHIGLADRLEQVAVSLNDEMSLMKILRLMSEKFGQGSDRLTALAARSDYAAVRRAVA